MERLGGILERLGGVLERLGGILERLGGVLEASWSVLEPSWSCLGVAAGTDATQAASKLLRSCFEAASKLSWIDLKLLRSALGSMYAVLVLLAFLGFFPLLAFNEPLSKEKL